MGENGRVETHRVLHHEDHLHPHPEHIVIGVHLVLEQLDYSEKEIHIAEP